MRIKFTHLAVVMCCALAVAVLVIVGRAPVLADSGCPSDLVPRNAQPGDLVCVTKQVAAQVAQENANAANLRQPGGGAYGPLTCKPGYVWREAFVGDGVCVTPDRRQETLNENGAAEAAPTGQGQGTAPPKAPLATTSSAPPAGVGVCPPACLPTTTTNPPPAGVGACPPACLPTTTTNPLPAAPPPTQSPTTAAPPAPKAPTTNTPTTTTSGPITTNPPANSCDPRVDLCVR